MAHVRQIRPDTASIYSRVLSFRNLVSGYECGRVFPAGVGPGSPSRDAANWLPSRFGLSVETRRQYGWLRMVFSGVRLFRAPIWCSSGGWRHARGREHCRGEPGSSLSGGYAPDSAKVEGSSIIDEPGEGWTPVRENRKREPRGFWGKSWSLTTVVFLPTRATWSGERARFVGLFPRCTGLWTAGCWLARQLHQLKASTTMDLGISFFLIFVRCVALRNLEYCYQNWLERICPICCWERWSWVDDNNPSR